MAAKSNGFWRSLAIFVTNAANTIPNRKKPMRRAPRAILKKLLWSESFVLNLRSAPIHRNRFGTLSSRVCDDVQAADQEPDSL